MGEATDAIQEQLERPYSWDWKHHDLFNAAVHGLRYKPGWVFEDGSPTNPDRMWDQFVIRIWRMVWTSDGRWREQTCTIHFSAIELFRPDLFGVHDMFYDQFYWKVRSSIQKMEFEEMDDWLRDANGIRLSDTLNQGDASSLPTALRGSVPIVS